VRWFYFALPIVLILYTFVRGRQIQKEKGHVVVPPHDLFGHWTGQGWVAELAKGSVIITKPDGGSLPIDAVLKQTYKRGYVIQQMRGLSIEKLAFVPIEMNEKHFTKLVFVQQKDIKTLTRIELVRT
jgi:hypothetical protein